MHMRCVLWPAVPGDGRTFDSFDVTEGMELPATGGCAVLTRELVAQAASLRQALCYSAADAAAAAADGDDDGVGDACISSDGRLPPALLLSSLRRSCRARTCVPGKVCQRQACSALSHLQYSAVGRSAAQHLRAASS